MNVFVPTELRNHLYRTLEKVGKGEIVCVKTRTENLYIISEHYFDRLKNNSRSTKGSTKVSGRILGSLKDADSKLKNYMVISK